jgi:hypothetical protein
MALNGYYESGFAGAGIGASALASLRANGEYRDVHSNLLGALVETGPMGLFAFLGLNLALVLGVLRIRDQRLQISAWVILLPSLTMGVVHTTYAGKWFWLPVTLLAVLLELDARTSAQAQGAPMLVPESLR